MVEGWHWRVVEWCLRKDDQKSVRGWLKEWLMSG